MGKCKECEFCFPGVETEFVCADAHYGEDISNSLEEDKDCYTEGLDAFIENCRKKEEYYVFPKFVKDLDVDGRKRIEFVDLDENVLSIKFSKAKKSIGEVKVIKKKFEDCFLLEVKFSEELFKHGKYVVIK